MLIIEGCDNLGKTTAARKLVELAASRGLTYEYRHMSRPKPPFDFFHDYRPMMATHVVQDRFHLGARAWHSLEETGMTDERLAEVESWIKGLIVVFVADDITWYHDWLRSSTRDEMFDPETILKANQFYRGYARERRMEVICRGKIWTNVDSPNGICVSINGSEDFPDDRTLNRILERYHASLVR